MADGARGFLIASSSATPAHIRYFVALFFNPANVTGRTKNPIWVWANVYKSCHGVTAPVFRGCFGRVLPPSSHARVQGLKSEVRGPRHCHKRAQRAQRGCPRNTL